MRLSMYLKGRRGVYRHRDHNHHRDRCLVPTLEGPCHRIPSSWRGHGGTDPDPCMQVLAGLELTIRTDSQPDLPGRPGNNGIVASKGTRSWLRLICCYCGCHTWERREALDPGNNKNLRVLIQVQRHIRVHWRVEVAIGV